MARTADQLRKDRPAWLTVRWCDRSGRAVNENDEPDHFHAEQCGGCRRFKRVDADWGYCRSHESVYGGRRMFEHDTCRHWLKGRW